MERGDHHVCILYPVSANSIAVIYYDSTSEYMTCLAECRSVLVPIDTQIMSNSMEYCCSLIELGLQFDDPAHRQSSDHCYIFA